MDKAQIQTQIDRALHESRTARKLLALESQHLREAQQHLQDAQEAQAIAQQVAATVQEQAHRQIAQVVTACLQTVFGDDYAFRIHFERRRGKTEAQLILIRDGQEILDPSEEDSGGVVNVASFALRLACLVLAKPPLRKILILDEPFHHVSQTYRPAIRQMMKQLAEDFNIQFLLVTHEEEYMQGKIVHV